VVDVIERLNLNEAVRDGIARHSSRAPEPATLEGAIVRLVDRIAYINHDIDDALRAGVIAAQDLPAREIEVLGDSGSRRIDTLVHDLVEHSARAGEIVQGEEVGDAMARLRTFMFERVYMGEEARREHARIDTILRALFDHYVEHPPSGVEGATLAERVTDRIAGMTDRFSIREFEALAVPRSFA
jgi:dGTPase